MGRPLEAERRRRKWLLVFGFLSVGISLLIYFLVMPTAPRAPADFPQSTTARSAEPGFRTIEGEVKERGTLFRSLSEKKIPLRWIDLIVSKLKSYVDFKKTRGGTYRIVTDGKGELNKFIYEVGPAEIYEIEKEPRGYLARRKHVLLDTRLVKVVGEIRSSLFETMDEAGEQDSLTIVFAEILAWEIDFYKHVRKGDRFKVVVEKVYKGDQFVGYGSIRGLEYQTGNKIIRGVRYNGDYYDENGISLKKAFLKAPLRFTRISSRFSWARKHPILGGVKPHLGVDYAAPPGTPIWAVADGIVLSCRENDGFGNQVILRHMNGYTTCYGHLSRFGHGIRKGTRVKQKQVIGYVGSTGLSTGPHLDYRLLKDGQFRNPVRERFIPGIPIQKKEIGTFERRRAEVLGWLQGGTDGNRIQEGGAITE